MNYNLEKTHDSNIIGFINDVEKKDLLVLMKDQEKTYTMIFKKVKHLKINNFGIGNIVLNIEVFSKISFQQYFLRFKQNFIKFLELGHSDKNNLYLDRLIENITNGTQQYIEINTSIGCDCQLICESYDFLDGIRIKQTEL